MKSPNNKIIFGLKVRQLRTEQGLSFADLSNATGMSVSYLNEIEKGKKFPKQDKIDLLAFALKTDIVGLMSAEMPKSLAPIEDLLQSNFLSELPLDLFGIEMNKVVEIIANAPMRVGAFISTLVELSRNYALREENFYFAALRSYLELNNNYFEDLEEAVRVFVKQNKIPTGHSLPPQYLASILEKKFGYKIVPNGLDAFPELRNIRSVFIPKTKTLLLNSHLSDVQLAFQYSKELGFSVLGLKERALTSSLLRVKTFDEALNHFKAGYFSAALLMNQDNFAKDIEAFLKMPTWDEGAFLKQLMQKYQATPEMLFQRITNVLPHLFGLEKIFFLRFIHHKKTNKFEINKELHLNRRHQPHSNGLDEHYCRRWISVSLLEDLQKSALTNPHLAQYSEENPLSQFMFGIQRSKYHRSNDEYLCFTIARPDSNPNRNISVTIGILIDNEANQRIKMLNDPLIQQRDVAVTCERCSVFDCAERSYEPTIVNRKTQRQQINDSLNRLIES